MKLTIISFFFYHTRATLKKKIPNIVDSKSLITCLLPYSNCTL